MPFLREYVPKSACESYLKSRSKNTPYEYMFLRRSRSLFFTVPFLASMPLNLQDDG